MQYVSLAQEHDKRGGTPASGHSAAFLLAAVVIVFNLLAFALVQSNNANLEKGDFKMYYAAALALRSGHSGDIYNHDFHLTLQSRLVPSMPLRDVKVYTHPPYELLIFWPLSYLPYKAACYSWLLITLLLAILCGRMLPGYAAVLGLFPLLVALLEQQDSVLALLIVISCWLALSNGRDARAGFLLGLALFRFQLILPLAFVLFLWKPRILRGFILSGMLVFVLSLAMVGPTGLRSYVSYMTAMAHHSSEAVTQNGFIVDPRTYPTIRGLVYELAGPGGGSASPTATRLIGAAVGLLELLCLAFTWVFMRREAPPERKFAFAILAGLLLSFYLLMHDLVLLAVPFVLLRGLRARWALVPFYIAPLIYCFYPHSQAWLALLLVFGFGLIMLDKSRATPRLAELHSSERSTGDTTLSKQQNLSH